jgi:hypothetical protein
MQILAHIPDELAVRFKAAVPARQRSAFIANLLSKALPEAEDALYRLAVEVEQDQTLNTEMKDWNITVADGIEEAR